ncbi:hypothetical protein E8E14_010724 [Neopestalotiopsis sp. 37M]|nr:hypothetical protein E8E14_010724 [Neopestalotiopsis sp. 37M]
MEVETLASASNESAHAPVRSIAEAAHDALTEFEGCLALTLSLGPKEQALIQDQVARFSLWSSTIGVFAPDRASMDYRLRDAQDTKDLVQDLLQGLCSTLTKCMSKLASWVQQMELSEMPDAAGIETLSRDVQKLVQRCADDIGLLHRLSNTIRKASRENQNSRAASSFRILDAEGNNMEDALHAIFLHHMEDQFPGCDDMLRRRLASAMVLRRRRILYRRSRLIKDTIKVPSISQEHPVQIVRPPHRSITLMAPSEGQVPEDDQKPALDQPPPLQSSASSRAWTATTLDVDKLRPPTAPSVMSFAKTVPLKREHNLIFPPPPRAPTLAQFREAKTRLRQDHRRRLASLPNYELFVHHKGCPPLSNSELELLQDQIQDARQELKQQLETEKIAAQLSETEVICPYCCWTLSARDMRNETKWQEHLRYDLDPYVCLFENCEKADELYTHSEPWLRHMKQHALRWTCTAKSHLPFKFDEKRDYEEHMRTTHKGAFTDAQLSAVAERIGKTTGPLFQSCPLCGISDNNSTMTESLEDHVVGHLRFLALKALPVIDEEQEDEDTDSFRSSASNSAAQPADRSTILGLEQDTFSEGIDYEAGLLERTSDHVDPIDPFAQWGGYRQYVLQFSSHPLQERFAGAQQPSFLPPDDPDASAVDFIDPSDCYEVDYGEARQSQWGYVLATTTTFHNGQEQDPILKNFGRKSSTTRSRNDWATHYNLKRDDIKDVPRKEIERQNVIHELVDMEEFFLDQLDVLNRVYLRRLMAAQPNIIPAQRLDHFVDAVFGNLIPVTRASEDLLARLRGLQNKEGPWITGVSSIFRDWVRQAKGPYLRYAEAFPYAAYLMRVEIERNHEFQQFVEGSRTHHRSGRLGWETFLKAPIIRADFLIIGTDRGLYHCGVKGSWAEASFSPPKVTSLKVHIEFGIILILADRTLFAIRLQDLHASSSDVHHGVITYATSVSSFESCFTTGKLTIVYLRKDVIGNDVRIIVVDSFEQPATSGSKRPGLFGLILGNTKEPTHDPRAEYTTIKAPAESHAVHLSGAGLGAAPASLAIATSKGFWETTVGLKTVSPLAFLDDSLLGVSPVPDVRTRSRTSRALGMFGIDKSTDLFVYDDRAIVMDKLILGPRRHSRTAVRAIEYSTLEQKPTSAAVYRKYLLLFFSDFVEIRNIQDGKLSQVISGSGIRLLDPGTVHGLDDGLYTYRTNVIFSMDRPNDRGLPIILELQLEPPKSINAHELWGDKPGFL